MKGITAVPMIPEQKDLDQRSGTIHSESAQGHGHDEVPHDSDDEPTDDEPMVYETPRDYATSARQERDRLIAEGADPDSVILQSEVRNHVPRQEGESSADYDGRFFDLGPGSGATKREFREFSEWFSEVMEAGQTYDVPEKWLKFETPNPRDI
ncbi:hypothetical protein BDV41DRAFT_574793 [Aspergillus transmontanensis]|uniref:Uncharacterized protein n=1 Tax=Aspergillus transmontanensis TaxID=1034304 RepID=A0A5N6W6J1_9EURO|nr:hypothetical protein BDV41DRAFT_574793 [Aspergillus transmontanensis]